MSHNDSNLSFIDKLNLNILFLLPIVSHKKENNRTMAQTISNISELSATTKVANTKTLSFTEELQKINKIKYNLSLVYFAGVTVLLTTLFL